MPAPASNLPVNNSHLHERRIKSLHVHQWDQPTPPKVGAIVITKDDNYWMEFDPKIDYDIEHSGIYIGNGNVMIAGAYPKGGIVGELKIALQRGLLSEIVI